MSGAQFSLGHTPTTATVEGENRRKEPHQAPHNNQHDIVVAQQSALEMRGGNAPGDGGGGGQRMTTQTQNHGRSCREQAAWAGDKRTLPARQDTAETREESTQTRGGGGRRRSHQPPIRSLPVLRGGAAVHYSLNPCVCVYTYVRVHAIMSDFACFRWLCCQWMRHSFTSCRHQ